jgi:molybdate transport system ATP-binding protein
MKLKANFKLSFSSFNLDAHFTLPSRGITAIFGESGSGKSTILRCIAGLEKANGSLRLDETIWQDDQQNIFLPAYQRAVGYVFQDARLFPHLSVIENLRFGYQRQSSTKFPFSESELINLLGLNSLLQRNPRALSGGEKQRVAIGRALMNSPDILLMDEPLSALDEKRKQEILPYLETLHHQLDIPILYVTHTWEEIIQLADHLILIKGGRVTHSGELKDLIVDVNTELVHRKDAGSILQVRVLQHDNYYQLTTLSFDGGQLQVPKIDKPLGEALRIKITAKDVSLTLNKTAHTSILNIIEAKVVDITSINSSTVVIKLQAGSNYLLSHITHKSCDILQLEKGKQLYAQVKGIALARNK